MADYEHLRVDSESGLVTIEITQPPHNVLDIVVMAELERAVGAASRDESAKVLMITGAGEKAFSAGVDVADHTPDKVERMLEVFHGLIRQVMTFPVPTVAALNGSAMGGGCELAISCDMVIAREGARIGQPEVKLGVFAPVAAILLPRIVPPAKAVEILLGGGLVTADEAKSLGLVNHVYPSDSFAADCRTFAGQFTSLSRMALIHGKNAVRQASGKPFQEALLQLERLYLNDLMATSDALEGLASFIEKRKPVWANR